jgi:hypothetical protein
MSALDAFGWGLLLGIIVAMGFMAIVNHER